VPVYAWQLMQEVALYHEYVVFETDSYWWSIEKQDDGVWLQMSKSFAFVADTFQGEKRAGWFRGRNLNRRVAAASHTVDEILRNYGDDSYYHFVNDNCQDFARAVYLYA